MRRAVGPGPGLFSAVVTPGAGPGEGIVALAPETGTGAERVDEVRESFAWAGNVEVITEEALDAVAALRWAQLDSLHRRWRVWRKVRRAPDCPGRLRRPFVRQTALATACSCGVMRVPRPT